MEQAKRTGYPSIDKPWLKYYSEEAINAPLPEGTIYTYMARRNRQRLHAKALLYFGREFSYRQLFRSIDRAAAAFQAVGVQSGEIVSICTPNVPEGVIAFYALNKIGAIACMLNPLSSENEMAHSLEEIRARILILIDPCAEKFGKVIRASKVERTILVSPADSMPLPLKAGYRFKKRGKKPTQAPAIFHGVAFYGLGRVAPRRMQSKRRTILPLCCTRAAPPASPKAFCFLI